MITIIMDIIRQMGKPTVNYEGEMVDAYMSWWERLSSLLDVCREDSNSMTVGIESNAESN